MLEEAKSLAKSFGWIKEHALCGPNSQSFPELTRGVGGVSTGVEIRRVAVSKLLVKKNEDAGYEGDPILAGG